MKLYFLVPSIVTILLTACGGGGGGSPSTTPSPSAISSSSSSSSVSSSSSSSQTSSSLASSVSTSSTASAASCSTPECEATNKDLVLKIYADAMNKNQVDIIEGIFDTNVTLHIPGANTGATAEIALLLALKNNNPGYVATVKHITAEGDYVAVHWHLSNNPSDEFKGKALIDLYKFSNNKITDHWSKSQDVPATTTSGNSLFSNLYYYADGKPVATKTSEAENKELVTRVYLGLFNDKNLSLIDTYIDTPYVQHNPFVFDGREAFRTFVSSRTAGGLSFFATVAGDDLVWTFSGNGRLTVADIFRVHNKKIVEHWDVF
jgi:predicted SnoaL-like aldol condensation-catalyzing enzyme